jgi:hypothetical protein
MFVSFDGAGLVISSSSDVVSVVRNGAGDYSVTLNQDYPDAESAFALSPADGTLGDLRPPGIVHTSDTVKQVLWQNAAGVATDNATSLIGVKS